MLYRISESSNIYLRQTFAEYLHVFLNAAKRFKSNTDTEKEDWLRSLQNQTYPFLISFLTDPESSVKIKLMKNMKQIAEFFGVNTTSDVIVSHIITYLNDTDWMLKSAFLDCVLDLSQVLSDYSVKKIFLPLVTQLLKSTSR